MNCNPSHEVTGGRRATINSNGGGGSRRAGRLMTARGPRPSPPPPGRWRTGRSPTTTATPWTTSRPGSCLPSTPTPTPTLTRLSSAPAGPRQGLGGAKASCPRSTATPPAPRLRPALPPTRGPLSLPDTARMTARRESRPKGRLAAPDCGSRALTGAWDPGYKALARAGMALPVCENRPSGKSQGARAPIRARSRGSFPVPPLQQWNPSLNDWAT